MVCQSICAKYNLPFWRAQSLKAPFERVRYFVYLFFPFAHSIYSIWCFVGMCSAYLACLANGMLASYFKFCSIEGSLSWLHIYR